MVMPPAPPWDLLSPRPPGAGSRPRWWARSVRRREGHRPRCGCGPRRWSRPAGRPGSRVSDSHTLPVADAARWAGAPSKRTSPRCSTTTRWHSAATSLVWCVDSTTVVPGPTSDSISRKRSRCSGSSPAVGSSNTRSSGRPNRAWAMATLRRIPPESLLIFLWRTSSRPTTPSTRRTSSWRDPRVGHLLEDGDVVHELERAEVLVEPGFLRHVAESPTDLDPVLAPGPGPGRAVAGRPGRARAPWPGGAAGWSCPPRWGRADR